MKTSVIIRIIIWSVVAILLLVVLIMGLGGKLKLPGLRLGSSTFRYNDLGYAYTVYNGGQIEAPGITNIDINWVSGQIEIEAYDGNVIKFSEESNGNLEEDARMRYFINGGDLTIQFCANNYISLNSLNKKLKMQIPKAYMGALDLDNVSANVDIGEIVFSQLEIDSVSAVLGFAGTSAAEVDIDTVSGAVKAENCSFAKLDADSVSGAMTYTGAYQVCDLDSTSGAVAVNSSVCPAELDIDTISGAVTLTLPENDGFTVKRDSVSGSFTCQFETALHDGDYIYKNGAARFKVGTVSGSLYIHKAA